MNYIFEKKNKEVFVNKNIDSNIFDKLPNLCWDGDCIKTCFNCKKIASIKLIKMDELDFVTNAVEERNDEGEVLRQRISECKNYEQAIAKEYTAEEIKRHDEIKKAIMMYYFDTDTYGQALVERHQLMQRGALISYKPSSYRGK